MRTVTGTDGNQEDTELGMELRIIAENDTMVLLGVPVSKQEIKDHLPFIASIIEAAQRLIRR